jgi:hypothetical protein
MRSPVIVALAVLTAPPAAAQSLDGGVDVAAAALTEAWDLNGERETLAGVIAGVEQRLWRAFFLRVEGTVLRVSQQSEDAWLRGVSVGTRLRWGTGRVVPFVDLAVGASHATERVPPAGTQFNLLAQAGGGARIALSETLGVDLAARWFHVSNNGREGRARNPDIQSLGAVVAVGWRWGTSSP